MIYFLDTSIDPMWDCLISAAKMWYGYLRENKVEQKFWIRNLEIHNI